MKKTVKMIGMACLLGAFAFAGSSCKKNNNETTSVKVNMPVVAETTVDGEKAYIDYSDDMQMKWSAGDQIMVYNLNEADYTQSEAEVYTLYSGANTAVADFRGKNLSAMKDSYYIFYPASKVADYPLGPRNSQKFDVPAEQNYNGETMDPTSLVMAYKNTSLNGFNLDHIFGFIDLRMKGTKSVKSIELVDKALNLTGSVTLDLPQVNDVTLQGLVEVCASNTPWETYLTQLNEYLHQLGYTSEPTGKSITLNCGTGVQLNTSDYTHFILSLRPGCLAKGFVVNVTYTDDSVEVINKFNPESTAWAYGAYPQYPRGFSIIPGNLMRVKLN